MRRVFLLLCSVIVLATQAAFSAHPSWKEEINSLLPQERIVLETFFKVLCERSQAGYVIWGNKPVCSEGIVDEETPVLMLGNHLHRMSIYLKAGWKVWSKLSCAKSTKNLSIVCYENPLHDWIHFSVINKKAFLDVVAQNLSLFQYVLGPHVTPAFLLEKALNPSLRFEDDILKGDKVLIGIILGFGTQNALFGSREEYISEYLEREASPPFKSEAARGNKFLGIPLTINQNVPRLLKPSLEYSSLEEEQRELIREEKITGWMNTDRRPLLPWFGCWPSAETEELLSHYRLVQSKIYEALQSKDFLMRVLTKVFEEEKS